MTVASSKTRRASACVWLVALAISLLSFGCSANQRVQTQHNPDGTIRLTCTAPLQSCLAHADAACGGSSYSVISARDQREHFGAETGTSRVELRSSDAVIRCNAPPDEPVHQAAQSAVSPPPAPVVPKSPATFPNRPVCVPGSTQSCVGPGACKGGQACLPDATGYSPCDCGLPNAPDPASPRTTSGGGGAVPESLPSTTPASSGPVPKPARATQTSSPATKK